MAKSKTWTPEDEQWIRDNHSLSTNEMLAHFPGRTHAAMRNKRQEILSDMPFEMFYSGERSKVGAGIGKEFPDSVMAKLDPDNNLGYWRE